MNSLIKVIDCLDERELNFVNNGIDSAGFNFEDCTVFGSDGVHSRSDTKVRSSTGITLPEDESITMVMHGAINKAIEVYQKSLEEIHWRYNGYPVPASNGTTCYRESIQVLEYTHGQLYDFHHDTADNPEIKEYHRDISVVLYLKNAELGGGTIFPQTTFKPLPGQVLIFPSNWCYPHSGEEVLLGTKRVAVTWYYTQCVSSAG